MSFAVLIERTDRAIQRTLGRSDIEYRPAVGDPIVVSGIYDANHEIQNEINFHVEQVGPVVWIRLEDIAPHDPRTDEPTIVIDGAEYRVREHKPDSPVGGSMRLLLQLKP